MKNKKEEPFILSKENIVPEEVLEEIAVESPIQK